MHEKADEHSVKKRMEVIFSGTVQGVGFRYTTQSISRQFPVTGFVRNLASGKVEVVAEAEEDILKEFLSMIRGSSMSPNIKEIEAKWKNPENTYKTFSIEF